MFQKLSDSELISNAKKLAAEERKLLTRVLEHLEEIERRKLHLRMGFSSLFVFCQRELGYSENEAHARISAMRLSREVPEVLRAVEEGKMTLTNLAQAQSFFRKAEQPLPVEEKRKLLKDLEGLSSRECERKLRPAGEPMRKTFEVDEELLFDLKRIRELWGNQDLSDKELLRKMAKLVLARIDPELKRSVGAPKVPKLREEGPPPEMLTPANRHIPMAIQREVWRRDRGCCTYQYEGQKCESRHALQFDHLDLYSHGGAHTADNLRLLCRAHHRLRSKSA